METIADEFTSEARQKIYEAVTLLKSANELILKALDKDTWGSDNYTDIFKKKLKDTVISNTNFILNQPLLEN